MEQAKTTSKVNVSQAFRDAIESFVTAKMDSNPHFAKMVCSPNSDTCGEKCL